MRTTITKEVGHLDVNLSADDIEATLVVNPYDDGLTDLVIETGMLEILTLTLSAEQLGILRAALSGPVERPGSTQK